MWLIPITAILLTFGPSFLVVMLVTRKKRREGRMKKRTAIIIAVLIGLVLHVSAFIVFFGIYSHATDRARSYLQDRDGVKVRTFDEGYFFDGPGTRDALIFYPGAKVEEAAYAELMHRLAKEGIDTFLISMPLRMAFLGKDKASGVIEKYSYEHWYISGHSLGGAIAASYAIDNPEPFTGLIPIAAYATDPLSDRLKVLSIVGTQDRVLEWDTYEKDKANWPPDAKEVKIGGGNHAQFGDYGEQRGDGEATISYDQQLDQTVQAITSFIKDSN